MPADPACTPRALEIEKFSERVNRYALKVEGLGGFLGIGAKQNKGKAVVTNSTINNTASARNAEARVRIGSAY